METRMTQETTRRTPPEWLFKFSNPILKTILNSPLHAPLSNALMLITVTGRKTGRPYTFPVGYQRDGERLMVFTVHGWWRNLGEGAPVTLRLQGRTVRGIARPTRSVEDIRRFVETFSARRSPAEAQRMGLSADNPALTLVYIDYLTLTGEN